jgi:integrase
MARPSKNTEVDLSTPQELTAGIIERLRCPDGKGQAFLRDTRAPGLRVRVTAAGAKSFVFETKLRRQTVRRTIGDVRSWTIEAARVEARRLSVMVDGGEDPREADRLRAIELEQQEAARVAAHARQRHTLRMLCTTYCDHLKARKKSSHVDALGIFTNHLLDAYPGLADRPAAEVEKSDVVAAQRRLIEAGKSTTARKLRAYLRAAYACALRADSDATLPEAFIHFKVTSNPVEATAPIKSKPAKNHLPASDLRAYWTELKNEPGVVGAALRLHVVSGGQRVAQLARLQVEHDVTEETIRLWDAKGKRAEPRPHLLPITKAMRDELAKLAPAGYALSTDGGETQMHPTSLTAWARDIAARAGIAGFQLKRVRSGIETLLAEAGVALHIRGQLQSHGLGGVQEAHYDAHSYMPEKRKALHTLHRLLEQEKAAKVVPLRAA